MTKNNLGQWRQQARLRLSADIQDGGLSVDALAAHVLERERSWLTSHPETELTEKQIKTLDDKMARLAAGEPLPYLTGRQEFYGLSFQVSPAVLIPRPETEGLVERALAWLKTHPNANHAADIGTGSGCIPVTLAVYAPHLRFDAGDISMDALAVARSNAALHKVEKRIRFVQSNLLETLPGHYDLITANLPYIPIKTLTGLAVTHYEPNLALDGGPDGLQFIRRLLQQATTKLKPGGFMLLEIEATIGPATLACASEFWPNAAIRLEKDLAGLDRYLLLYTS